MQPYERKLFLDRYKNPESSESSWLDVFQRVVDTVVVSQRRRDHFMDLFSSGLVIPGSPQLWNYGSDRRYPRNGSSCFTLRIDDTLASFREADSDAERVFVASGGAGFNLDLVRPRGCWIRSCAERSMGTMCAGGPVRRIEQTTGYITGSGRARGAVKFQLSVHHPDILEFIFSKHPSVIGWADDWPLNAAVVVENDPDMLRFIHGFGARFLFSREWPCLNSLVRALEADGYSEDAVMTAVEEACDHGIVEMRDDRVVPMVFDWEEDCSREAQRDWDLPMQNCNMSVRVTDAFMRAVDRNDPWVLHWHSPESSPKPLTRTDAWAEDASIEDISGLIVRANSNGTGVTVGGDSYRYGVVITTWEGVRENMKPSASQWRDTDYARFYRRIICGKTMHLRGKIMARQLWRLICECAHNHADPGVVFSDTYELFQPIDSKVYGPRHANPCAEYVYSPGGCCDLISVNARECAEQAKLSTSQESFERFLKVVGEVSSDATDYINMALMYNEAPVEYVNELSHEHFRAVGVGLMGLAEVLMKMHVAYGSERGELVAATVMSEVALSAWERSFLLSVVNPTPKAWSAERSEKIFRIRSCEASRRGLPHSHAERWAALAARTARGEVPTNTTVTSVAPTGTIVQVAEWITCRSTTASIEPTFAWETARHDSNGQRVLTHDLWATPEHHGMPWMRTASQITPIEHVRMQAAVAAFTCMSVSKTVNLPNSATVDDVSNCYTEAWRERVPGTSLYRDGSKPNQVLKALESTTPNAEPAFACPSGECSIT